MGAVSGGTATYFARNYFLINGSAANDKIIQSGGPVSSGNRCAYLVAYVNNIVAGDYIQHQTWTQGNQGLTQKSTIIMY